MSKLDEAFFKAYERKDSPAPSGLSRLIPLSEALDRVSAAPNSTERDAPAQPPPASVAEEVPTGRGEPAFRPMLQVDAFAWPPLLQTATPHSEAQLDEAAAALVELNGRRRTSVALAGSTAEAGCTTLLLGAARRLARRGVNVVLLDADQAKPTLGSQLGLLPSLGWEDVAAGRQPLCEVLIESIEDRLTLLPLCRGDELARLADTAGSSTIMASALATLRQHYDLVLLDLGTVAESVGAMDEAIDVAVLVHNVARATAGDLRSASKQLAARRIACAGVIENFAPPNSPVSCRRAA